jgi:hypothetical protein
MSKFTSWFTPFLTKTSKYEPINAGMRAMGMNKLADSRQHFETVEAPRAANQFNAAVTKPVTAYDKHHGPYNNDSGTTKTRTDAANHGGDIGAIVAALYFGGGAMAGSGGGGAGGAGAGAGEGAAATTAEGGSSALYGIDGVYGETAAGGEAAGATGTAGTATGEAAATEAPSAGTGATQATTYSQDEGGFEQFQSDQGMQPEGGGGTQGGPQGASWRDYMKKYGKAMENQGKNTKPPVADQSNVNLEAQSLQNPYVTSSRAAKTPMTGSMQALAADGTGEGADPIDANGVEMASIQALTKQIAKAKKRLAAVEGAHQ